MMAEKLGDGWDIVSWTVLATAAAAKRLDETSWHDPHLAYAATSELLWWIAVLDDCLSRNLGDEYDAKRQLQHIGDQIDGLIYARGRLTHALDVLEPVEPGGSSSEASYGTPGYWKWSHLPPQKRYNRGESEYQKFIAGHRVQSTLILVLDFLRSQAWRV